MGCHSSSPFKRIRLLPNSIPPIQQASSDHLRLDFGRALEDRENARVTQYPRNPVFERKAVAAMDLHRVVGGGPGDAGGEELRHAGLQVAATALVLFARRVIADLA